jgi:serine/threonine protein kinase
MPEPHDPVVRTQVAPPRPDTKPAETVEGASATGSWHEPKPEAGEHVAPPVLGHFEIRGLLGAGAFGIVYRAFDPQLHREVAIKVPKNTNMTDAQVGAFLREARAAANIHHQNVCPVYSVGVDSRRPFIVMHLVANTLAKVLEVRKTPFLPRDAAAIVRKLALGVAAAHAVDVTHRDLKPANVLVDDAKHDVLITDFGLALLADETRESVEGSVKGSPAYMSPEQAHGHVDAIGPPTDIHALGIILYELLTQRRPFQGNVHVVLDLVRNAMPKPPSAVHGGIDPAIDALCLKALAKNPKDRHSSARDLANALTDYLRLTGSSQSIPVVKSPAAPPKPVPRVVKPPAPPIQRPVHPVAEILEPEILEPEYLEPELPTALPAGPTEREQKLFEAVTMSDRARIRELVAGGADINARVDQGASVLFYACLMADEKVVKLLLELGADPNLVAQGEAVEVYAPKPLDLVMQAQYLKDWSRYKPLLDLLLKHGATDWSGVAPTAADLRTNKERARERRLGHHKDDDKPSWWRFWK